MWPRLNWATASLAPRQSTSGGAMPACGGAVAVWDQALKGSSSASAVQPISTLGKRRGGAGKR